ncbi:cytochrome P450 [Niveispirillum fermenti]|uniref:cytochrome P450 n=1 Tax=Niveispirillum fermenti TaxID=1233113 RepID=UPI003A851713
MDTHAIPRIRDFDDPDYDPFNAMGTLGGEYRIRDCYPELARLRRLSPVFDGDIRVHFGLAPDLTMKHLRQFAVLGHAECVSVLSDSRTFSNEIYNNNLGVYFGRSVTTMDGQAHFDNRRLFQKAFNPKMVEDWGQQMIPRMIHRLIDGFAGEGKAELVSGFTLHFPFHFIHELMALPEEDRAIFHKLAFGQIGIIFDHEHGMDAINKLKEYLTAIVHHRRAHPLSDSDLISNLARLSGPGGELEDDIVIAFFRQLMNAGGDTSYHGFSSVLAALLTHPEQLEAVRRDRSLVPQALEEGLRWNAPVPGISRTPTREIEIAGTLLRPGDHVLVMLGAANRDENAFPDPDRFDIFRKPTGHMPFGHGRHICIGQHLARMEMTVALNALLDRLPGLRADPDHPPPEVVGFALRGPHEVHVRFDPA